MSEPLTKEQVAREEFGHEEVIALCAERDALKEQLGPMTTAWEAYMNAYKTCCAELDAAHEVIAELTRQLAECEQARKEARCQTSQDT